jgi:hypothetical protein
LEIIEGFTAVNFHAKSEEDNHAPEELLNVIEQRGREVVEVLRTLRSVSKIGS